MRRPIALLAVLGLLAPVLGAADVLPGVNTKPGAADPRHSVELKQPPWRAIGRVQTELGARCTGFAIGPALVMTAAHCLYLPRTGHYIRPGSVHFLLRYAREHWDAEAVATSMTIGPGYDPRDEQSSAGADWALLVLARPVVAQDDVLALAPHVPVANTATMLGGYGQDRAEMVVADTVCHITGVGVDRRGKNLLRHDCAATRGTSGAPLLIRDGAGIWRVAGVQVLAREGGVGGLAARP